VQLFVATRDQAAFAALVERHGRLVLGVCRNVLRHEQDAEDAFQATFLVLARRAGSIHKPGAVASWLYGVAHRIALKARTRSARRQALLRPAEPRPPDGPVAELALRELQAILDEEVALLAEKYRAPFVLCCLEGKSKPEAAQELGWKEGTVAGRLALAREQLRRRLKWRGVALSAALCAAALGQSPAAAAVPAGLATATIQAAGPAAVGQVPLAGFVSAEAAALTEAILNAMAAVQLKVIVAFLAIAASVVVTGTAVVASLVPAETALVRKSGRDPSGPFVADGAPTQRRSGLRNPGATARRRPVPFHHETEVAVVAFSPDGKLLASAEFRRPVVRLWDAVTGKELRSLPGNASGASAIAFSSDGRFMAAGQDGEIILWHTATGKEVRRLRPGGNGPTVALAFASHGRRLASASPEEGVRLWDLVTGKLIFQSQVSATGIVLSIARDDRVLAVAGVDGSLWMLDLPTGKVLRKYQGRAERAACVALCNDGQLLTLGGPQPALWRYDATGIRELRRFVGPSGWVSTLAFAPDGKTLAAGHADGWVRWWDVATGKEMVRLGRHGGPVKALAYSWDGKRLVTGSKDGRLRLWDLASGREIVPRGR
jgi:RNA polymerase sigma factor (sigma-70 family)